MIASHKKNQSKYTKKISHDVIPQLGGNEDQIKTK